MPNRTVQRYMDLTKELSEIRSTIKEGSPASQWQLDYIAAAQAQAICDIAASLNGTITVSNEE